MRAVRDISDTEKVYSKWSLRRVFVAGIGTSGTNVNNVLPSVKPTITGPASPTVVAPDITWSPVSGAGAYQVYIENITKNTIEKVLIVDGTVTSYRPDYTYSAGGRYKAWVRAIGGGEFSLWSSATQFIVGN